VPGIFRLRAPTYRTSRSKLRLRTRFTVSVRFCVYGVEKPGSKAVSDSALL
jgi:hypothetical protein